MMKSINFKFYAGLFLTLTCFLFFLIPGTVYSQEQETLMGGKTEKEFAKKSLDEYVKNFLSKENVSKFGFTTLGQAEGATLGDPYKVMIIELKSLKAYQSGMAVKELMTDPQILWYPVMVNGAATTKLEIIKRGGKLIAGEFGRKKIIQEISGARDQLARKIGTSEVKAPEKQMLVKIPFLRAMFIYITTADGEFLIPSMIQPQRFKLENGRVYPANEVLSELSEIAKKIDEKKIG